MDVKNLLIIAFIIFACIGIVVYYAKALKKTTDTMKGASKYSITYLTDRVAEIFANSQKENLSERNLTKREYDASMRKKQEMKTSLKTAAFGDETAKKFIKSYIKDILQSKQLGVNEDTIDKVIPFNNMQAITLRDRVDILLYLYQRKYKEDGFRYFMTDNSLDKPKNVDLNDFSNLEYEVTAEDINRVFAEKYKSSLLQMEDKLEILARRIFADYKGFGVVDPLFDFAIDEIDAGTSGVPEGTYTLKERNMTKGFEYSFNSIYVTFRGINYKLSCMSFGSQAELERVCQNIYKFSAPYALSRKNGYVTGVMKDGSRISVSRPPAAGGWCFYARKFDSAPSASLTKLITDTNNEYAITLMKWIMRATCSVGITGVMGAGKTTTLRGMVGFSSPSKAVRVYEIAPELNLQFTYPKRNIMNFATTESITMQELYDFGKKTNASINIVGESASAEMGVIVIQSATVGGEQAIFTHHAKSASDLILSLRDNLTTAGGYSSEKVAEEVVAKCINFNIHMGREKGHRYVERITEIVPIRDRSYPYDKAGNQYSKADTVEYYKRMTDRRAFEERDIVRWVNGEYRVVNKISNELTLAICNKLNQEDEKIFTRDMDILYQSM